MRQTVIDMLLKRAETDKNLMLLTADLGAGALEPFMQKFPNQFLNCGIAEQNMIGVSAGLALSGKTVVIYSIGNFDTLRVLEFLRNLVCFNNLNVKILSVGAGVEYGSLGFTHHATDDISALNAIPNLKIYTPATVSECEFVMNEMLDKDGPCVLRLNKKGIPSSWDFEIKKGQKIKITQNFKPKAVSKVCDGNDGVIFTTGTILKNVLEAKEILKSEGYNFAVYSVPVIKPLDKQAIAKIVSSNSVVACVEEQLGLGGFGSLIANIIAENNIGAQFVKLSLGEEFISVVGSRDYILKKMGLDASGIAKKILKTLEK